MRREIAWLRAELPGLVERGVLSAEAADALRRHYGRPGPDLSRNRWGQVLLASFGALLVGGGVILILAHNWEALGRPARAAIALGALLVAQALTLFAVATRRSSTPWIEACSGFLVAAVGAALALVGQTYHVGGSFEGLMRGWLWLVLPIPYLTGSRLAAIGFWGLLVVRVIGHSWRHLPLDPWLLIVLAAPFVVERVRREPGSWGTSLVTIAAATATFIVGTLSTGDRMWNGLWAVFQVSFVAAIVAVASWPPGREVEEPWRQRLFIPGWLVLIGVGTILSFDDAWSAVSLADGAWRSPHIVIPFAIALGCATVASVVTMRLARAGEYATAAATAGAILIVVTHALALVRLDEAGWVAFNLWLLAVGILTVVEGVRGVDLAGANRGLLALAALVIARFFDAELSFLTRGLGFVALGAACFMLNVWLMRRARGRVA